VRLENDTHKLKGKSTAPNKKHGCLENNRKTRSFEVTCSPCIKYFATLNLGH